MCILLTRVFYCITTVLGEIYHHCCTESVSLRDKGKPTSRAEISSPSSLYLKAVKGAHLGSALAYLRAFDIVFNLISKFNNPLAAVHWGTLMYFSAKKHNYYLSSF